MNSYQKLFGSVEIDAAITKIASEIVADYPDQPPLFVSLLRGAAPFTNQLMFEIVRQNQTYHPELDYMMISTYGSGQTAGEPHIVTDLAPSTLVRGRDVIVCDDVLDKGITADFVFSHLKTRGARSIKLCVLGVKDVARDKPIEADYAAFHFGSEWLVGMGMDDAGAAHEAYRWLGEIWKISHTSS